MAAVVEEALRVASRRIGSAQVAPRGSCWRGTCAPADPP